MASMRRSRLMAVGLMLWLVSFVSYIWGAQLADHEPLIYTTTTTTTGMVGRSKLGRHKSTVGVVGQLVFCTSGIHWLITHGMPSPRTLHAAISHQFVTQFVVHVTIFFHTYEALEHLHSFAPPGAIFSAVPAKFLAWGKNSSRAPTQQLKDKRDERKNR